MLHQVQNNTYNFDFDNYTNSFSAQVSTAYLLGARDLKGGWEEQAGKFASYVLGQGT